MWKSNNRLRIALGLEEEYNMIGSHFAMALANQIERSF
jgi:hypothetical protein